ncbi:hypothetical protein T069G_08247 [Trichoderma breve]|uniref:Uncharacterized protein n=1 Tax=Trichoderma breve TaxID=2034170 RepID=A0A9W9B6E9_9HYPO|nr:hypothetical protein T069G_08247 [Trichoderma breve]KAJ4857350.1 hypothetical protein T069G_08247 [Trichoderma breve]
MTLEMDLDQPFTLPDEGAGNPTELAIPPTNTAPPEALASQDGTTSSRRLRPRKAKTPATPSTTASTQSTGPRRSRAKSTTSKKTSRAASKKKVARRETALATTQAEQQLVTETPAAALDSTSQPEAGSK